MVLPTAMTSSINTMIEFRASKRYSDSCFNSEVMLEKRAQELVLETPTTVSKLIEAGVLLDE